MVFNVTREPANPITPNTTPENGANNHHYHSNKNQNFSNFSHAFIILPKLAASSIP